ncbi:rRNA-processing protein RRP36 NDAI_0E00760 [Naumovozyma dairenensis CBS 421]|uniref:rRNA biogenesis protein RRP36 n=1 Tax=Naumovozyma dairenensis (strain ATCC 10597 / BCRC 20456 / CBS 421 / NBRC 0211 / NRRL Y-12639) TaxID=1071378 RepID=G0WAX2_NAUDC|nr:hypothetical protein NDAI_0E00760 [Naumovozyma dairenensis CBS 421]CCD24892.1 hypothetical protein NDAI_0E00760 [Naumovozyma dairenensis CBS 421]
MSYYFKNLKPEYESEEEGDDDNNLESILSRRISKVDDATNGESSEEDEMKTISFSSLKKADQIMMEEEAKESKLSKKNKMKNSKLSTIKNNDTTSTRNESEATKKKYKEESFDEDSESDSDDEGAFFEEEEDNDDEQQNNKINKKQSKGKKKGKHAPIESSSKKRLSKRGVREIPGLNIPKTQNSNLYQDIRFDKSTGESTDLSVIRRRYQFLDEYREKEISELTKRLHDRKFLNKITDYEKEEMESKLISMKSRLQSVKNKDLERKIVKEYEDEINRNNSTRYHLKDSEKRKVIQKWKFDHMKAKQREKVMERKRKKRLGKEFKQFEFHQNNK